MNHPETDKIVLAHVDRGIPPDRACSDFLEQCRKFEDELVQLRSIIAGVRTHPYLPPSLANWINLKLKKHDPR
jgi:hypothetical protein